MNKAKNKHERTKNKTNMNEPKTNMNGTTKQTNINIPSKTEETNLVQLSLSSLLLENKAKRGPLLDEITNLKNKIK